MKITVMTLFPEFFDSFQTTSIIKKALEKKRVEFECVDYRKYTLDKHNHVDDTPCGGGVGMLLMVQPIVDCLKAIKTENSHVVLMCPQGKTFKQSMARKYVSTYDHIILICGHYEGYDERIRDYVDEEVSIGDFVLTGQRARELSGQSFRVSMLSYLRLLFDCKDGNVRYSVFCSLNYLKFS